MLKQKNSMKKYMFSILFLLLIQFASSQSGLTIKESKKIYVHGSSILIGNNILGHHESKPLMDDEIANDMLKMKYIDIDDDKNTFSSSQASVVNGPKDAKVKYAALYWSALYPYAKGVARTSGNKIVYKDRGVRDSIVNSILFRRPNDKNYKPINGVIIYDAFTEKTFENNMPYVCYADVTKELQQLTNLNGNYTIANVRATEGQISGGGSAGWLLYIIYEDASESLKYFTTYDGLVEVNRTAVELTFRDFKNKEDGDIHTTIALGAMEGDRKIKSDMLSVFNEKSKEYVALSTSFREEKNFFNSSITIGNELFSDRDPNSTNTLGFDLLKMEIPNENNKLFDHNTTQAKLKFETRADRFYLHFVAFETEISIDYLKENIVLPDEVLVSKNHNDNKKADPLNTQKISSDDKLSQPKIVEPIKEKEVKNKEMWPEPNKVQIATSKKTETNLEEKTKLRERFMNYASRDLPGMEVGYYIVTNVFEVPEKAESWSKFLSEQRLNPESIRLPDSDLQYIYIENGKDYDTVFESFWDYRKLDYLKDIWVMKVNDPDNIKVDNNDAIKEEQIVVREKVETKEETIEEEKARFKERFSNDSSRDFPGMEVGYYIVTNVFGVPENAKNWSQFLTEKNFRPKSILLPESDLQYIYIKSGKDFNPLFEAWWEFRKLEYFKNIWIMKVNM